MAYALELAFDIPPAWGYLICSLVVIPMVTHGITVLSRMQVWTQPLALVLTVVPFIFVLKANPNLLSELAVYPGLDGQGAAFDPLLFGAALTVGVALITQMGEQADYLRFMPEKTPANRVSWWSGVLLGGVGWVIPGVLKMLGGAALAVLVLGLSVPSERAVDPNQMYLAAWETVFADYGWAVAATTLLVVVCQLKINVTNAYAGSLAWSNFFARLTHSHPGRVVWVVFNTLIALMLMELGVFKAIGGVLGLYSNLAISWIMAVVADLVVNKPLGWSPKGISSSARTCTTSTRWAWGRWRWPRCCPSWPGSASSGPGPRRFRRWWRRWWRSWRRRSSRGRRRGGTTWRARSLPFGLNRPAIARSPPPFGLSPSTGLRTGLSKPLTSAKPSFAAASSASATTKARTWPAARPMAAPSAACAAASTRAVTTCANPARPACASRPMRC